MKRKKKNTGTEQGKTKKGTGTGIERKTERVMGR